MPIGAFPSKRSFWQPVLERFQKKLALWKCRLLSAGACVTLVNSVLTALPLYFCSLFKMPVTVFKSLNRIMRAFFLGETDSSRKVNWVSWDKICLGKDLGGLGIPNIKHRNTALLLKWWSRFGVESNALWKRVLVDKYYGSFPNLSIINIESNSVSKLWMDIISVGDSCLNGNQGPAVKECFKWSLGNGNSIRFWHDNWLAAQPLKQVFPRVFALAEDKQALVSHMDYSGSWRIITTRPLRGRAMNEFQHLQSLLQSVQVVSNAADSFSWTFDQHRPFSVALAYDALSFQDSILSRSVVQAIWLKWSPPRVRVFCWKAAHDALPTRWNMLIRGIIPLNFDPMCALGCSELETQDHIFISCSAARLLWRKILIWWNIPFIFPVSTSALLQQCSFVSTCSGVNKLFHLTCVRTIWTIWYARNSYIFINQGWDADDLLQFIQSRTFTWLRTGSQIIFAAHGWFQFPVLVACNFK